MNRRLWEVDMVRGVAIIMVVVYHLVWDLNAFGGWDITMSSGFWHYFQRVTASTFVLLVGVSMTLSYRKASPLTKSLYPRYLKRGLKLLAAGAAISAITWLFLGQGYVQFGILHFIGISVMIAYPFLRFQFTNLGVGLILLIAGRYINTSIVPHGWLIWLGLQPEGYYAVDYFPMIPWFGLVLIGIFLGNWLYGSQRSIPLPDASHLAPVSFLSRLGQHTLPIYLLHQPILLVLLVISGVADIGTML